MSKELVLMSSVQSLDLFSLLYCLFLHSPGSTGVTAYINVDTYVKTNFPTDS